MYSPSLIVQSNRSSLSTIACPNASSGILPSTLIFSTDLTGALKPVMSPVDSCVDIVRFSIIS